MARRALLLSTIACACACLGAALAPAGAAASGLRPDWQRGMNVTSWWHSDWESLSSDATLAALRNDGSTDAAFVATWYMPNATASSVAPDASKTPSDSGLLRAMGVARSLGLRVVLKPHVDVFDGTFRGQIQPSDPSAWFASYRSMIDHYADLARQAGAQMLVVGTELTSMSGYTADWRTIVADARARFGGSLTFAANQLDGAAAVGFWDALDAIGIDAYMPLSSNPDPSVDELVAAWRSRGYVDAVAGLHAAYGKPVIFTEAGYQSRLYTAWTPWSSTGQIATDPQRNAYEAAYRVWSQIPWVEGLYWWDWRAIGFDPSDGDFGPRGKPAEQTMRAWNIAPYVPDPPAPAPPVAPPPMATVRPATQPSPPPRPQVRRPRAQVSLRARWGRDRRIALAGHVQASCAAAVVVDIQARARRRGWTTRVNLRARLDRRGSFRLLSPRLHAGSYRAVARVLSARCVPARAARSLPPRG